MSSANRKTLAIIPARGGSKNPPNKNILSFNGKPLIVHTIDQARNVRAIDRVVVSTDSPLIAEIAATAGAEVPFLRPSVLAEDTSPDLETFQHALSWLQVNESYEPSTIVHLRPTSPLRPDGLIDRAIEMLLSDPIADSVRTVIPAPCTPYKMWRLTDDYMTTVLNPSDVDEPYNLPRQLLPPVYWQNGYVDVMRWSTIFEKNSMTGDYILPLVMEPKHNVDIDSLAELESAQLREL